GHSDHLHSFFVKLLRDRKRIVTSDRHQRVEFMFLDRRDAPVETVRALGGIGTGSMENGSAARQDPAYGVEVQFDVLVFNQSATALRKPQDLVVVVENSFAHDRANDCVKTRKIPPAG